MQSGKSVSQNSRHLLRFYMMEKDIEAMRINAIRKAKVVPYQKQNDTSCQDA